MVKSQNSIETFRFDGGVQFFIKMNRNGDNARQPGASYGPSEAASLDRLHL